MKKRGLLLLFAVIFVFSTIAPAVMAAPQEGIIGSVLGTFGSIERAYERFGPMIDLMIYLIIFLGLAQFTIGRRFEGKGGKAVVVGIAIMFSLGLALFGHTAGFDIKSFGPIAALILMALIGFAIWTGLKDMDIPCLGKQGSMALIYVVIYFSLSAVSPNLVEWLIDHVPIVGALLTLTALFALILLFYRMFVCFSGFFGFGSGNTGGGSGGGGSGGSTPSGPRPPGFVPPSNNPSHGKPDDPPTPPNGPPSGALPGKKGQKFKPKPVKKRPPIPPEKEIYIDISPDFNLIRSQDSLGACSAFASTSIFEYILHTGYGHPKEWLAPMFNWYMARKKQHPGDELIEKGVHATTAMKSIIDEGVCYENKWKFEAKPNPKFKTQPDEPAQIDAMQKKLIDFKSVDERDPDQWVHELLDKNPLDVTLMVPSDWKGGFNKKFYHNPSCTKVGCHAMVVVGYHSHYPHNGVGVPAFKLRNSWGTSWGDNGYVWVSAETMKNIVCCDLVVVKGWKGEKIDKYQVTGRVIYDSKEMPINAEFSGGEIYENNKFEGCSHSIIVGAMVQKAGNLITIAETKVNDKHGKFKLKFKEDLSSIEHLTLLPEKYPQQFDGVDFTKLPRGVLIYKRTPEGADQNYYPHVASFKFTKAGRGGEGMEHPENPCSAFMRKGIEVSGVPIVFSEKHLVEKNVIIPICDYGFSMQHSDSVDEVLQKIVEFAKDESGQIAAEFKYLEILRKDLENNNYKKLSIDAKMMGRAESKAQNFEKRLETELMELIRMVPAKHQRYLKHVFEELKIFSKKLLGFSSRYTGEIKKNIDKLASLHPQEHPRQTEEWKKVLRLHVEHAITSSNSLQALLKQLMHIKETVAEPTEQKTSPNL